MMSFICMYTWSWRTYEIHLTSFWNRMWQPPPLCRQHGKNLVGWVPEGSSFPRAHMRPSTMGSRRRGPPDQGLRHSLRCPCWAGFFFSFESVLATLFRPRDTPIPAVLTPSFRAAKSIIVVIWTCIHLISFNVHFELHPQLVLPNSYFTGSPIT